MLKIENLEASIGENQVLRGIYLEVPEGETVAVLGANGAGKTSLIKIITGLLSAGNGRVVFKEQEIQNLAAHRIAKLGIACVPEGRRPFTDMSVQDNLYMGAYLPRGRQELETTLKEVLDLFPVLGNRLHQRAGTLSGGEQQMLAIGRALMTRADFLVLDELSLGLAPLVIKEIYQVLDSLRGSKTMLLVEQSVEQALKHSSTAYILETGRIVRQGPSRDLAEDQHVKEAYLGM